jgi:succinate dehydrogenase / fumarate reductase membrane anchor subunit
MVMVLRDHPLVSLGIVLLIVNVSIHMRIGMHEVIMDYLDENKRNRLANIANNLFAIVVPALTILAVVKIMFWG